MSKVRRGFWRFVAFWRGGALDAELDEEMKAHIQLATDEMVERGVPPAEARRRALVQFGGVEQARHRHREARGLMDVEILVQDLKYTFRTLWRDPGFTVVAVLILGLGIGVNVAVFSVVNTLMLRPLPFAHAQELVWIAPPPAKCGLSCATYSTDAYDEFRVGSTVYQDVTGYFAFSSPGNLKVRMGNGAPVPATSIDVIANFFDVLEVRPAMGRLFRAEDGRNGAAPVIVLSDAWWRRQFGADPNIVGKAFDISGTQTTVIGVLPKEFDFGAVFSPGAKVDAITPLNLYGPPRNWGNIITMIGRMKPGVTLGWAVQEAARVAPTMCWNNRQAQSCGQYKGSVVPVPLKEWVSGRLRNALKILWGAVGMIMLIACVNLSNLLLARASSRSKEFAMRGALGASRGRIVRQLLTESLILAGGGAVMGLALASLMVGWLSHQGAIALPLFNSLRIDGAALGWTVLIAMGAALLFGIVPGLRMAGSNLNEALKSTGSGQGRRHERLRSVLVISEVALACMLLVGSGLLLRSFLHVLEIDLGFQPEHAAAVTVDYEDNPADGNGSTNESARAILNRRGLYFRQLTERVIALPGVVAVGTTDYLPLTGNRSWGMPWPKGVKRPDRTPDSPLVYVVTPGYLRAIGTRVRGRDFTWDDRADKQSVVVINESFAKYLAKYAHWPNNDALGQVLDNGGQDLVVAGVAEDVHAESVDGENGWQIYWPAMQTFAGTPQLTVRSTLPPAQMATSVMAILREMNVKQSAAEFKPVQILVDHSLSPRRFFMFLVAAFAGLGLLLAALGIYGLISYSVTRQTQEIGIRMALGATAGRVQRYVMSGTLRLAVWGIVLGTVASVAAAKIVTSMLYDTSPWDAATYSVVVFVLFLVAAVAGYIPAFRASRLDAMVALRTE
jgi:predicted permease